MSTNKDLNYRLYVQKNDGFMRIPFNKEFEQYRAVSMGNTELVKQLFTEARKDFNSGKGKLSDDPVRNMMYHFVVATAVISRMCVEEGLGHDTAYTLADIYVQRGDKCTDVESITDLFDEMLVDYSERMRALRKENVISIHIRKCIDYIYDHLHENLSMAVLSKVVGLSPGYLSRLFQKERGMSVKEFVTHAKIETSENLLKFSDFSYLDISLALGFCSQSAFISTFKKINGITPKQYREIYYMKGLD